MTHDSSRQAGAALNSGFNGLPKLIGKDFDDLADRMATLNERADYWLSGEFSWLFKKYVSFEIGFVLKFALRREYEGISLHGGAEPRYFDPIVGSDVTIADILNHRHHEPMLIDVVRGYHAPEQIPERVRSIGSTVGFDFVKDDFFEIGILPAKLIEMVGLSGFSTLALARTLFEAGFNTLPLVVEGEDGVAVRDVGAAGHDRNEVVQGRPQVSNGVPDTKGDFDWNGNGKQVLLPNISRIILRSHDIATVVLETGVPICANLRGVEARLVQLQP